MSAERPTSRFLSRITAGALLFVSAAAVVPFTAQGWSVVTFPYPVDYGEGPLLDQAVRLARFENIYDRDLASAPFVVANYPPVYLLAQVPWVRWFGPAFWYGRLVSWLCAAAAALLVALIARELGGDPLASIVGGAAFLAIPYVTYWAPLFRIDSLALASSLAGLFLVVRWPARRPVLWIAALLLSAAVFTRQSQGLAAPLAAFVGLVTRDGDRRRAAELAAVCAVAGGVALLVLQALTEGGFLFHTVTANLNAYRPERLLFHVRELVEYLPGYLLVGAAFVVVGRRANPGGWSVAVSYLAGATLAGLTIGKVGSNVNYWLELCAAVSLAAALGLAGLRSRPAARSAVALLLILQISVLLGGTRYRDHVRWKLDQRPALEALMDLVRRTDGIVVADEALGLLPLAGRPVHAQPFELTQLALRGSWDPDPFLAELDARAFAAVIVYKVPWSPIHRTRWTPEMLDRLERAYRPAETVGHHVVYRPREL